MPFESPNTAPVTPETETPSGFAPLHVPLFRDRWIASTISSLGTWMQDTAGAWFMTALTSSPLLIALMQTAASLPVLLFGLLAGATADIFDRRKLLIFWQTWMGVSVAILALLTFIGTISPWTLLAFTFLLNIGSAMNNPAWQAIVPELVPRPMIPDAVALNSASNNLARALGPALGGLMVAAFQRVATGAGSVFLLNAASFAAVIWVLLNWKRTALFKSALPAERVRASISSGLRYIRNAPDVQAPLLRAFVFTFFVSAIWSLLPLVALHILHQGALGYGFLNGSLGLGALLAATQLPRLRQLLPPDRLVAFATALVVMGLLVLAFVPIAWIVVLSLIVSGFAWTSTMSTLNTTVQLTVPPWVQARAMGAYLMGFQGGLALGSILWGTIAGHFSTEVALAAAGVALGVSHAFTRRFHLLRGPIPDHTPYAWRHPAPQISYPEATTADDLNAVGPVRVSIQYRVPAANYAAFTHAIHQLRGVRMRDGALRWGIYRDAMDPEILNETFIMESWLDYLRSREHMTAADDRIRSRVHALHSNGGTPPQASYQIYVREVDEPF